MNTIGLTLFPIRSQYPVGSLKTTTSTQENRLSPSSLILIKTSPEILQYARLGLAILDPQIHWQLQGWTIIKHLNFICRIVDLRVISTLKVKKQVYFTLHFTFKLTTNVYKHIWKEGWYTDCYILCTAYKKCSTTDYFEVADTKLNQHITYLLYFELFVEMMSQLWINRWKDSFYANKTIETYIYYLSLKSMFNKNHVYIYKHTYF